MRVRQQGNFVYILFLTTPAFSAFALYRASDVAGAQTDDQQDHHHHHQTFAAKQTQLEEATVGDIGGMSDVITCIHYLSFSLVFAHADYGNDTHHVAKRPQSEWPKASTVRGPMVQVRNKPVLFVLIDNPISQSVMFFFFSLPIAITNGSTWSFRSIKTCCMPKLFVSDSLLAQSAG